jgi:hypothetical protein
MSKQSSDAAVEVVLVKADPAPPAQLNNTWTLEVKDAAGNPIAGANVVALSGMPDHNHPAAKKLATETEPGVYEVVPYFSMPGYWETMIMAPSGGGEASVIFGFCID